MTIVRLFCANGFSTAMLCKKMAEVAREAGCDYDVKAFSYSEVKTEGQKADFIFLGPQISFNLAKTRALFPGKPVEVIDSQAYGQLDGKACFEIVQREVGA